MTIWERLDIEPTHDLKTIKRAYAKMLQVYHPEEDAEGYQALREAYDRALKFVKEQVSREAEAGAEAEAEAETETETPYEHSSDHADDWVSPEVETYDEVFLHNYAILQREIDPVQQFIEQAADLYQHFPSRINPELWLQLLNSDVAWDTTYKRSLNRAMLDFVQSHRFFPSAIWRLLEDFFHWKEEIRESLEPHIIMIPGAFQEYYLEQLNEDGLNYEFLLRAENINFDEFLQYREHAHQSLRENKLKEAGHSLRAALQIFYDDPDLLRLLGEYYFRISQYGLAVDVLTKILQLLPDDVSSYYKRAQSYYYSKQFELAILECEFILKMWPEHLEVRILLGQCYNACGQLRQALAIFRSVLNMTDPNNKANYKLRKQALYAIFEIEYPVARNEAEEQTFNNGHNNDKIPEGIIIPILPFNVNLHNYDIHQREIDPVQQFIEQAAALYQHFPSRINPELWLKLLNSDIVWDTVRRANLSRAMLELVQTYRYLPSAIWRLLEDCFHWEEVFKESLELHIVEIPVSFKEYYMEQLNEDGLNYEFLLQADNINIDEFLQHREHGYRSLKENKLEEAGQALKHALQLFNDDPDLLRLLGEYYYRTSQYSPAVNVLTKELQLRPDEIESHYLRAQCYYYSGQLELAELECEFIIEMWPEHLETRILLGHCYVARGQREQALASFRFVLDMTLSSDMGDYMIRNQALHAISEIEERDRTTSKSIYSERELIEYSQSPEGSQGQRSSVNYGLLILAILFILKFILTR
ncbi:hypothetical protein YSY43_06270 [Paenibacillus sp. YSY-4.3]